LKNLVTGQTKIVATGTLQALPSSGPIASGVTVSAPISNTKPIAVTASTTGTGAVDGTGVGYIISPGGNAFFPVPNASALFVGGTALDVVSWSAS
jgi:hypothetical protein